MIISKIFIIFYNFFWEKDLILINIFKIIIENSSEYYYYGLIWEALKINSINKIKSFFLDIDFMKNNKLNKLKDISLKLEI